MRSQSWQVLSSLQIHGRSNIFLLRKASMTSTNIWKENTQAARIDRWQALWALEDLPRPLWFVPADPVLAVAVNRMGRQQSVTDLFSNKEVQLQESLRFARYYEIIQRFFYQDDYVLRLQPQLGIGVFASAFGSKVEFPVNQYPMCHSVITPGQPAARVYDLKPPDVRAGQLADVLAFAAYFEQQTARRYPIAMTDLQGPMDTAYLVWNSTDFLVAMIEHPREVHHLLNLVTDLIIRFVKELRQMVKHFVPAHFPPVYLPDGMGIALSEDVLAVIGARQYEEFSLPYINRLSEEFGGVVIHSCGNIEHQIPVLKKVNKLRAINFGATETRFEALWDAFGGKTVLIPHLSTVTGLRKLKNTSEFVRHILSYRTHNRGLALMVVPGEEDIHVAEMNTALGKPIQMRGGALKRLMFGRTMRRLMATIPPRV
jgi:hypothetical protein